MWRGHSARRLLQVSQPLQPDKNSDPQTSSQQHINARLVFRVFSTKALYLPNTITITPIMTTPSILIGGTIAIDHVKTPEAEGANLLGGSAAYAALAAAFFHDAVDLIGIIGHDFPADHLAMLESKGVSLSGVERSESESFTWSGEYHTNMNERTTHRVGLNVLENWQVKVPGHLADASIVVLANMSPDNQLQMLAQCGIQSEILNLKSEIQNPPRFIIADTMDLWIAIANERLHEVLPHLDLFVLNEGEARELAGTSNLIRAGRILLEKGPRHVVIKLGEFGAILFSSSPHSDSAEIFRSSAWPLEAVADPTGAGDTFLGAIAGHLAAQGPPPYNAPTLRQAIIHGTILASFTCEAFSTRRIEALTADDHQQRLQHFRQATHW